MPRRSGKIRVDGLVHQVWKRAYRTDLNYCFCVPIALRIGVDLAHSSRTAFVLAHATTATVLTCFECALDPDDPHGT